MTVAEGRRTTTAVGAPIVPSLCDSGLGYRAVVNDHTRQLDELPIVPLSDPPAPNDHQPFDPYDDRRGRLVVVGLVFALMFLLIAASVWWATDPDGARSDALVPEVAAAPQPTAAAAAAASSAPSSAPPTPPLSAYPMPAKQAVAPTSEPAAPVESPPTTSSEIIVEVGPPPTVPPTTALSPTTTVNATSTTTVPQTTVVPSTSQSPATTSAPAVLASTTTVAAATTAPSTSAAPVTTVASPGATLLDAVAARPELSRLHELVGIAQLEAELAAAAPRTLFAPSNAAIDAFAATPEGGAVLADPESLRRLLLRHLVAESLDAAAIFSVDGLEAMSGDTVAVDQSAHTVEGADLLAVDVSADNGFLHVVSAVFAGAGATDAG